MVNVTLVVNLHRYNCAVDPNTTTIRSILEEHNVDYVTTQPSLGYRPLQMEDLDKTFADFDVTEKCHLVCITKQDGNA